MRVAGSHKGPNYSVRTSQKAEMDRHVEALQQLAKLAREANIGPATCTLVLRSAKSAPALALAKVKDELVQSKIGVNVILTKVEPEEALHALFAVLASVNPDDDLTSVVRWAKNPRLMDAHEQAVYGPELCWTGDAVRRDAGKRNPLALFESGTDAILRGAFAFKALWAVSDALPTNLLDADVPAGQASGEGAQKDAPAATLDRPVEGWPLLRH